MKNVMKIITAAAFAVTSTTAAFAGSPEAVLNNQVEEPVIVQDDTNWQLIAGAAVLTAVVACAVACGSSGDSDNNTPSTPGT